MIDTLLDGISSWEELEMMPETTNDSTYESGCSTLDTSIGTTDSVSQEELIQQGQMGSSSYRLFDMTAMSTQEQTVLPSTIDNSVGGKNFSNVPDYNLQYNNLEFASADSAAQPTVDVIALNQSSIVSSASGLDVDNLVNTPRTDILDVSNDYFDLSEDKNESSSILEMSQNKIKSNSLDGGNMPFLGAKYSDAEIEKMRNDVERAEYEVSCRKSDVNNWESKVSLNDTKEHHANGDYAHAVSKLNDAKSRYNNAINELNNAKQKLNSAT